MKLKGKVFLAMIAMMIFLLASTCIAKEVKAEELYTIAGGILGVSVEYTIKIPTELGETMPIVFEFTALEHIKYFEISGSVAELPFEKEYTDMASGTKWAETFEVKLARYEVVIILFKYGCGDPYDDYYGGHLLVTVDTTHFGYDILQSQLESQINEINNLKTINTQLSSQLSDLQKRYDSLERDYKGLERDYDTLKKEYESLKKAPLPFLTIGLQWLTPVFIVTTVILAITTIYFATRKH